MEIHTADALYWLTHTDPIGAACVMTDPPYSSGGLMRSDRNQRTSAKYSSAARPALEFEGDSRDQRSFMTWAALWLTAAKRHTIDGGNLVTFCDWRQYPIMTDAVQAGGWTWRGVGVWQKPRHASRPTKGGFWNDTEYMIWASNGPQRADYAPFLPGVFEHAAPADRVHITEKPLALMVDLMEFAGPGEIVLDPFAGSGTTGAAALLTGRKFVGIELKPDIAEIARRRLANVERRAPLNADPDALTLWEQTA